MCGIIGYLGEREAAPILLESLQRLEYRGYDSAGVAVLDERRATTAVTKTEARVDQLIAKVGPVPPPGHLGVGHTRWATHGRPTLVNAHPHVDCSGRIAVVHNGIIENFAELKAELTGAGHRFQSDTDTEVVPHLVEHYYRGDLVRAVRSALLRLEGAFALVLFSTDDPELLVGARRNAPLVVGLGDTEQFLASDITALVPYTRRMLVLGEGEMAALTPLGATVTTFDGHPVERRLVHVDWDVTQAEKGGYPHFMRKEIAEAPDAIANAQRGRIDRQGVVQFSDWELDDERLRAVRDVRLLGMGTSLHAAMIGERLIEDWAGVAARAEDSSEFRYRRPTLDSRGLAVAITQSGETADTIAGMRQAAALKAATVAVTNVVGSTAAREADGALYLNAGPEIGVCSSKTFVAHLVSLSLLALRLSAVHGSLDPERREELWAELHELPAKARQVLDLEPRIAELARKYAGFHNFMYFGRGLGHAVALEGALKLKEISYVHAEGVSGGDLKHGPIALLDRSFPVVAVCTQSSTLDKMAGNVQEVAAREAPVLALVSEGDESLSPVAEDLLAIPRSGELGSAVLGSVALQLFAYHLAVLLGRDVDRPRNLAKSVTVE
ncbi:MAG: glutamine--fructose-6-phosphate transaminase (isomerizing) [Candidatus Dormibacteraeota bacterium]|nr:glutamine--fructose-6-phosphate transaminase (isomerizing) [Candidatus Dormibacteraeota bacterium]